MNVGFVPVYKLSRESFGSQAWPQTPIASSYGFSFWFPSLFILCNLRMIFFDD